MTYKQFAVFVATKAAVSKLLACKRKYCRHELWQSRKTISQHWAKSCHAFAM